MWEVWNDGVSGVLPDVQEDGCDDEDDDPVCGEIADSGAVEYECYGEDDAGG